MKTIVIGSSLSGKTTLVRYIRSISDMPVLEMDESLVENNGGVYPVNTSLKHGVLAPEIISDVLDKENIIFFTNTDYFALEDLKDARNKKFKIILLSLSHEELLKRNKERISTERYEDVSKWLEGMLSYQKKVEDEQLADQVIDATLPTETIAGYLLK